MSEFLNPAAEADYPDSGKLTKPEIAYQLKETRVKFFCPDYDCRDSNRILIPKKSVKGNYFFSHRANCEHDIRPETLLHKLAIKWFEDKDSYELPSKRFASSALKIQEVKLDKTKTECEFRKLQRIIPDVKLTTVEVFDFAIEIIRYQ